ncbi:MAG: hypothetical protein AB9903_09495 [Vulcanimicrobiota bacterium]
MESPDLWKSYRFDRTGKVSPELDLSKKDIMVVKKNLKPGYYGIDILILVKSGTPNPFPNLDKLLHESLAGKFDQWHHIKTKKKFVMAGNVCYDKGKPKRHSTFGTRRLKTKNFIRTFKWKLCWEWLSLVNSSINMMKLSIIIPNARNAIRPAEF